MLGFHSAADGTGCLRECLRAQEVKAGDDGKMIFHFSSSVVGGDCDVLAKATPLKRLTWISRKFAAKSMYLLFFCAFCAFLRQNFIGVPDGQGF
jgi:hypothetical protein